MVSTRQMSITTIGPDMGSTSVTVMPNSIQTRTGANAQHSSTLSKQSASSSTSGNANSLATTTGIAAPPLTLLDMPYEILDKILSYTGYKQVSHMRLVSTQMNQTCTTILNSTFSKLQLQMSKRFQNIKKVMPRRESARRSHSLSYECDIVETCSMRLSLLQMAFGRYIEHKHCCFFPGAILDEVYSVINYIRITPPFGRPYKITEELIDLSTMAMEYFKDHLEPTMPQFGMISKDFLEGVNTPSTKKNSCALKTQSNKTGQSSSMPSPPQSNMVLRKGIRKIKQGMKKYNNQLTVLRSDLRFCKRKSTDQTKQISELQNMLAEQQKQTLEYANRLDDNDKKSEEMSRKISTLLQELNKCKIELHYWRSKSPATPICNNCGHTAISMPSTEDLLALMNQTINSSDDSLNVTGHSYTDIDGDASFAVHSHDHSSASSNIDDSGMDVTDCGGSIGQMDADPEDSSIDQVHQLMATATIPATITSAHHQQQPMNVICNSNRPMAQAAAGHGAVAGTASTLTAANVKCNGSQSTMPELSISVTAVHPAAAANGHSGDSTNGCGGVILTVGSPKMQGKRKYVDTVQHDEGNDAVTATNAANIATVNDGQSANSSNFSDNSNNKKARRVQNKVKCQTSNLNIKTRNK